MPSETALAAATAIARTKPNTQTTAGNVTPAAADATNGNSFPNTGRELLLLQTGAATRTVVFKDVNGVATATVNLAASKSHLIGPFPVDRYGSTVKFTASNTAVTCAVFQLSQRGVISV